MPGLQPGFELFISVIFPLSKAVRHVANHVHCFTEPIISRDHWYLMHDELVCAVWKSPPVFLHEGNKRETKQLLLSFLLCCKGEQ